MGGLRRAPDANGEPLRLDVFKEAGGANRLLERAMPVTLSRPGEVTVTLTPVRGEALISALVLEPREVGL